MPYRHLAPNALPSDSGDLYEVERNCPLPQYLLFGSCEFLSIGSCFLKCWKQIDVMLSFIVPLIPGYSSPAGALGIENVFQCTNT